MANELFSPGFQVDPEKDYTPELIGEGKKFADVKSAARSLVEKDLFIQQLQREAAELREDLGRRKTVEDAISSLQNTNSQPSSQNGGNTPASNSAADEVALDEETLNRRIRETVANTLQQATAAQTEQRNIESVKTALESVWGKNFSEKLTSVAEELSVTQEYLTNLAKTSPKVFLRTVGADQPVKQENTGSLFAPSAAGVNTAALARGNASNLPMEEKYSYWQKVRKENPTLYHSPEAASKRFEAAKKHGEAFYAN